MSTDEYEEAFGAIKDDDSKTIWTVKVSPATVERVKRIAGVKGITLSDVVDQAIEAFFKGVRGNDVSGKSQ